MRQVEDLTLALQREIDRLAVDRRSHQRRSRVESSAMREFLVQSRVDEVQGLVGTETALVLQKALDDAALVLEEVGLSCADQTIRELLEATELAAFDETTGRVHVLRDLVYSCLEATPRNHQFWMPFQSYGCGGTAPFFLDDASGELLEATPDLVQRFASAVEKHDLVSFTGRGVLLNKHNAAAIQTIARETQKTMYVGVTGIDEIELVEQIHRSRGNILIIIDIVHSPLTVAENMAHLLLEAARRRIPLILASMPMPAVTAPYAMSGLLTLAFAEYLAGLVVVQTVSPGALAVCGAFPTVTDIKRQYALDVGGKYHNLANVLMSHLPRMLDIPACQSGCTTNERTATPRAVEDAVIGHSLFQRYGCHMVRHAFGFTRDLLAFSFEKMEQVVEALGRTTEPPTVSMPIYDEEALAAILRSAGSRTFMQDPHTVGRVGVEFTDR